MSTLENDLDEQSRLVVPLEHLKSYSRNKGNAEQVREDIHDTLKSYYKVARKRFVDNVCQQAIHRFLLSGKDGPLAILSPTRVAELSESQLEAIAGESSASKSAREGLAAEIQRLSEAMKVMRG